MIGLAVAYAGLLVSVATLLWRVWRLETRAKDIENNAEWLLGCIRDRAHKAHMEKTTLDLCDVQYRTNNLARALGYEWKRTDAKEGWEKKPAPMTLYGLYAHKAAVLNDALDRRKADRRKPALTYTANAQGADGKVRKVSSKKRRAH